MHNYTHAQNLMTTNWQIVRLKLPVPEQNIGWRVEFRTMEVLLRERVTSYPGVMGGGRREKYLVCILRQHMLYVTGF